MIRPRRMKSVSLTVLSRDVDRVLEFLGKEGLFQPSLPGEEASEASETADLAAPQPSGPATDRATAESGRDLMVRATSSLARVRELASYLSIALPPEPGSAARLPTGDDDALLDAIGARVEALRLKELGLQEDRRKTEDALTEAQAFAHLDAPFAELEKLSYLTLRLGRVEARRREELSESLGERAVLVPLGDGDRILAASSRKGRFALDSELKKTGFEPIEVPEGFTGVPAVMLEGLKARIAETDAALSDLSRAKEAAAAEFKPPLERLSESYAMAVAVETLKGRLESTASAFALQGWVIAERVPSLVEELERLTDGRVAVTSFDPDEVPEVQRGEEKVPVSLEHGRFVGGFERVVFSYGAPLYGTIDPTPFVAVSFTVLFGLMFGDLGQGFVLFLLGLLAAQKRIPFFPRFSRFSPALTAVGVSSMIVGLLDGEVFSNESLLIRPTRAITGFLTGIPVDRVLHLMPEKGSLEKLFAFFGFTIGVGVVLNTVGLVINIANLCSLKRWEKAFFSKTGLSGALLFWYAIFLAVRLILGGSFSWFDWAGLGLPAAALFFGPALWRFFGGHRPVLEHGTMAYVMEGLVEILESTSYYLSNTVSFLRVGAFALSHAVLSFIVFTLGELVAERAPAGPLFAFFVLVFGNAVIILLEGLIVAIQTIRLQYYEFFSKFFTETGVEFAPFRFRKGGES